MINKISFTGRETMLTSGIEKATKKAAEKTHEYVSASMIYPQKALEKCQPKENKAVESIYTSPFAMIKQDSEVANDSIGKIINFFG